MKQRRWIVLSLLLPLLLGGWAWVMSRQPARFGPEWQPQKLGSFYVDTQPTYLVLILSANRDMVRSNSYIFDLKTKKVRYSIYGNLTDDDGGSWELVEDKSGSLHLEVTSAKSVARYDVPSSWSETFRRETEDQAGADFYEWDDTVVILTHRHLYRWRKGQRTLDKSLKVSDDGEGCGVIDEKKEVVIYGDGSGLTRLSARDGKRLGSVQPEISPKVDVMQLAKSGRYVLYGALENRPESRLSWTIYEGQTGRALWKFETPDENTPSFFIDEQKRYLLAVPDRQLWEVRDAVTGEVKWVLPLVPGTLGATLSPDGNTLYSVAGGVLYRQRAR